MTPAPGQGTIAVEVKANNTPLIEILAKANDKDAETASMIERTFSDVMGGGCKAPTGAYASRNDGTWKLIGMVQSTNGAIIRETMEATEKESAELGVKLADKLLARINA